MGAGVAANILTASHELTVWNRSPGPVIASGREVPVLQLSVLIRD
jgi:3-hydroxyisobutyrate dehydrogenase-like beta-hydroxyacid dehydrogenase